VGSSLRISFFQFRQLLLLLPSSGRSFAGVQPPAQQVALVAVKAQRMQRYLIVEMMLLKV